MLLAGATIVSSLLGLLRDRFLASTFGAGAELDIYYAAFRIPDFLYTVSILFIASTAIIPVFLDVLVKNEERAREIIHALLTIFLLFMGVVLGIVYLALPNILPFLVPGFGGEDSARAVEVSRILLLSPLFLGLSHLLSSVTQTFKRFFIYALSPLFYNMGIIGGIIFLVPRFGLSGLAVGVVVGAFLHMAIQLPSIIRLGFPLGFTFVFPREIKDILMISFPRTIGLVAMQLTFIAITAIASTIGVGSIAVFNLSYNLQSIPLSVIGLSYSIAAFPTMAELVIKKDRKVFFDHLGMAARHIMFWTMPLSILFLVLRAHIVRIILGAGAFGWVDTRLTAASLALFSFGIVAQSLVALFVRSFYALGRTTAPVVLNVFSMGLTVVFAFVFVSLLNTGSMFADIFSRILRVEGVPNISMLGLPFAFALGSIINAVLLGIGLSRIDSLFRNCRILVSLGEIMVSSALLGITSYIVLHVSANWFNQETFLGIFLQGICAGLAGIGMFLLFLRIRNNKEFKEVYVALTRKFWKENDAFAPEQDRI